MSRTSGLAGTCQAFAPIGLPIVSVIPGMSPVTTTTAPLTRPCIVTPSGAGPPLVPRHHHVRHVRPGHRPPVPPWTKEMALRCPPATLAEIDVPTALIWGRHDQATPLAVAEAGSEQFAWPLQVIDRAADDPALEQPESFIAALGVA